MSLEKSERGTQDDEPAGQVPHIRTRLNERLFLFIIAEITGSGIILFHRYLFLRDSHFSKQQQQHLTNLQTQFPLALHLYVPALSREHLSYIFVPLVGIYCHSLGNVISEREWRARYLPSILIVALSTLLVAAFFSGDLEIVFLEVLPGVMNLGILGALVVDGFKNLREDRT